MSKLPYTQYTEAVVGHNHPTLTDTDNRVIRQILTDLGLAPDGDPNPLIIAIKFANHGDTNYTLGDGTPGGQLQVYSQIKGYGAIAGGGADLVLLGAKNRLGGPDYDVHIGAERIAGTNGTGVFFIDTNIKVSDFQQSPFRGHGLQVLQSDNSVVIEFPIAGGLILMPGKLVGQNGANLDLNLRIGGASGSFVVQDSTGSTSLLSLQNANGNLAATGSVTGSAGLVSGTRILANVVGLTWGTNIALNAAAGNQFRVSATSNIAATISVPTNNPTGGFVQDLLVEIVNSTGGALGTPVAFAGGAGGFITTGGVSPANGLEIGVRFCWNSGRNSWIEMARSAAL